MEGLLNREVALRKTKRMLTGLGSGLPPSVMRAMRSSADYIQLGYWMRQSGFTIANRVADRNAVFEAVALIVAKEPTLYLEFGVFEGASLQYWSGALESPESQLHAFDSFQGLPETFDPLTHPLGQFDTNGRVPEIRDRRITYHVGWFNETVPTFVIPRHAQLLVTLDADLYSSTKLVLDHLAPYIKVGTILYFDDLSRPSHEPAAFTDFIKASGCEFDVVAADESLNCVAFRCR